MSIIHIKMILKKKEKNKLIPEIIISILLIDLKWYFLKHLNECNSTWHHLHC